MNNQKTIDETLQPYVEKVLQGLEKGAEFAIDMAPELLKEFYMWHMWSYLLIILAAVIGLIVSKGLFNYDKKEMEEDREYWKYSPQHAIVLLTVFILGLGSIFVLLTSAYYLLYLLVAPKLYLIDYFLN